MSISGIGNQSWDFLFQGQNASANGLGGTDEDSSSSDLNGKLMLLLVRRLDRVDKQIQQGQASSQLSSDEVQKLQAMEQEIQDQLQALQQGQADATNADLKNLSQALSRLNDELRKAMPEGRHHASRALAVPAGSQATAELDNTSQADGAGQSQSIDIYA